MTCATAVPLRCTPSARTAPSTLRLVGLASIVVSLLAASSAPTPLYATYAERWGFSALTTTVVFGVYAVTLLSVLLVAGRLSDHVGRRPLLLVGLAGQIAAMAVFTGAGGVADLLTGRVLQGVATGLAIGAIGAGLLDVDAHRGALANATAPGLGTGLGALLSAFAVQWLPAPTHLTYVVLIAVFALQAAGVVFLLPESSPRLPGAAASLLPRFALPREARVPFAAAAPVLLAVWALAGFYGSLGPALAGRLTGSASVVYGGLGLGLLAVVAAAATHLLRGVRAERVMLVGVGGLLGGVGLVLVAVAASSGIGFFAATVVAGIGFGAGFSGGIRLVVPAASPAERAGVMSVLYVVSYLGMGLPAVVAGVAVVRLGGLTTTTYRYGAVLAVLAIAASVPLLRLQRTSKEGA